MKKLHLLCIVVLFSTACTFAQRDKKPSKGILQEPLKTTPYDFYSTGRTMVRVTLPLRYYLQPGSFERYVVTVSNGHGNENAIRILCRILSELPIYYMETLDGFNTRDTIPPNTEAWVCTEDRSFPATVDGIVKTFPAIFLGNAVVSVKKIQKRATGNFLVMLPEDTKNILRVVAVLPDNAIKPQQQEQGSAASSNTVIMHADLQPSLASANAPRLKYENGFMNMYYSSRNTSDKDIEEGVLALRKLLHNSIEGTQATVSKYTHNWINYEY